MNAVIGGLHHCRFLHGKFCFNSCDVHVKRSLLCLIRTLTQIAQKTSQHASGESCVKHFQQLKVFEVLLLRAACVLITAMALLFI